MQELIREIKELLIQIPNLAESKSVKSQPMEKFTSLKFNATANRKLTL